MAHGVKFAEEAKTEDRGANLLGLNKAEELIAKRNKGDQPLRCDPKLLCKQDIFISFFFDGTNNNKYISTHNNSQTNVARLYEIFPGKGVAPIYAKQDKITGKATKDADYKHLQGKEDQGKWQNRAYRKIYIPGVGQPFYELGDSSRVGASATPGAAMAKHGEIRLYWALLQVITTLHTILFGTAAYFPLKMGSGILRDPASAQNLMNTDEATRRNFIQKRLADLEKALQESRHNEFKAPSIGKIRLSIFGFSRGAAKARVFTNWVNTYYGASIAGIPLQFDFLGIFDTVASVGIASVVPGQTGHMAWASASNMVVPAKVKRCAHLVSAHEIRASFPLDSVCSGRKLPTNCKEVVYPGVHSDLGGGYGANEQGKNRSGGNTRISQITLAQMYREAIMAGVPFLPQNLWDQPRTHSFIVDPILIKDFNAYVAATRAGHAPEQNNSMYPTETQPSASIDTIIKRHYGYYLSWRKSVLNTDALWKNAKSAQDKRDLQNANTELKYEIELLNSTNWKTTLKKYRPAYGHVQYVPIPTLLGQAAKKFTVGQYETAVDSKIKLWSSGGVKTAFNGSLPSGSVVTLFQNYVHDSRAWFKLGADDETDWYVNGKQKAQYNKKLQALEKKIKETEVYIEEKGRNTGRSNAKRSGEEHDNVTLRYNAIIELNGLEAQLAALKKTGGDILMQGTYTLESWEMWGYLRWRTVYKG